MKETEVDLICESGVTRLRIVDFPQDGVISLLLLPSLVLYPRCKFMSWISTNRKLTKSSVASNLISEQSPKKKLKNIS